MVDLDAAWDSLWDAMPARWTVGLPSYDPGRRAWSISAVGPDRGRGKIPTSASGTGEDEIGAICDLDARLRGAHADGPRKLEDLRARLRLAYVAGAEEWTQQEVGRPMTQGELAGVLTRFPAR